MTGAGAGHAPRLLVAHPGADLYGSDRMLLESVDAMVGQGWRVTVALPDGGPLVPELERRGVAVAFCPTPVLRKSALRPRGLARLAVQTLRSIPAGLALLRREQVQAVYVSTLTIPLWVLLARVARRPVAVHVHEAEGAAPALVRRALAAPLLAATVLLVNSRYSLQVLAGAVPALGRRGRIVPNGVAGPPAVVPARRALEAPVRLVYVGRLSPRKGVDVAVEAAAELARRGLAVRLDVVGSVFGGYEWFESDLRERVRQAGLADAVAFHGFQDDVWAHLAHADVVLVPSRLDEPFGNTAVEAALAARPVVVSDTSGLREAAADLRAARRVAPGDAAALADAVAGIAAGWEVARQQAAQDADVVARRHAPAGYRARIVEAMSGLLSRPAATRGVPAPRTQGSAGMAAAGPAAAETVPGREGRA